uniref:Tetraspanin n=1 Tax=Homalodisca liturata TaxID=320908 RepID=A0A1B6IF02_9HEMI
MLTVSSKIMKYLLFIFNFVFVLTGILLITMGIMIKSDTASYKPVLSDDYFTAANLLIFIGIFVFCVAFFGCCGSLQENHCMIVTFSVFMSAIFIAEVAIGVAGYMLKAEAVEVVTNGLNETMKKYYSSSDAAQFWDDLQGQLACCGTQSYKDWQQYNLTLPLSCCGPANGQKGLITCTPSSPELHKTPCLTALAGIIQHNASYIGITGIAIAFVQLLGVAFSCNLAHSIRSSYESV